MYYNMMASLCCAHETICKTCWWIVWSYSTSNPSEVTSITAGECCKDVKGDLRSVNCPDASLNLESELFLARQVSDDAFFNNDKRPVGNDGLESSQAWQCIQPSWASLPYKTSYIQDTT